jgi:two-component system, LytTR family, response regulator
MKYTAVIVDDEAHAVRTLETQLRWTALPIEVIYKANSVNEASLFLEETKPDFLFLDIKMPNKNGFVLLQEIDLSTTDVIFTTAHEEYALDAFNHLAAGYLLKPLSTTELTKLLNYLINRKKNDSLTEDFITLNQKTGTLKLSIDDILYVYSDTGITYIIKTDGRKKTVNYLLKDLEETLEAKKFFRVHHKYLVNLKKISEITKGRNTELLLASGEKLPVSRTKKIAFFEAFEKLQ